MKNSDTTISHETALHFHKQCKLSTENIALKTSFSDSSVQIIEKNIPFTNSLPDLSSCHSQSNESHLMETTVEFLRIYQRNGEKSAEICDSFNKKSSCENGHGEQTKYDTCDTNINNGKVTSTDDSISSISNCTKSKKVRFADDVGNPLSETRIFDPDDELILHNLPSYEEVSEICAVNWNKQFRNPIKNYLTFYNKLNTQFVLLESVHIKDNFCEMSIMVKNIGFEKNVSLRATYNNWKSIVNVPAFYCPSQFSSPYDKFSCTLATLDDPDCDSIEFAICFVCSNKEYWDNNNGENYVLTKTDYGSQKLNSSSKSDSDSSLVCPSEMRYDDHMFPNFDFYKDKYDMYSSWNHFSDEKRYY